jgi:hypothetical protein
MTEVTTKPCHSERSEEPPHLPLPLRLLFNCHPSPQAEDLLLSLPVLFLHPKNKRVVVAENPVFHEV